MPRKPTPEEEHERLEKMRYFEYCYAGYGLTAGVDEAGRGPLAGPVVAAAVILPPDLDLFYLNDSKKVTAKRRDVLYDQIREHAVTYGIGFADPEVIDEINILQATYQAMRDAVSKLSPQPSVLLNDAVTIPGISIHQVGIIKGDSLSVNIAAASILAKVTRDRLMAEMDEKYPGYGFAKHKGYGTAEHIAALRANGPCPIHRKTFIKHFQ